MSPDDSETLHVFYRFHLKQMTIATKVKTNNRAIYKHLQQDAQLGIISGNDDGDDKLVLSESRLQGTKHCSRIRREPALEVTTFVEAQRREDTVPQRHRIRDVPRGELEMPGLESLITESDRE